jgi:hypothetical protein
MTITPRSSSGVPSAFVPVQWISAKTVSPSTADRTISPRKSGCCRASRPIGAHLVDALEVLDVVAAESARLAR